MLVEILPCPKLRLRAIIIAWRSTWELRPREILNPPLTSLIKRFSGDSAGAVFLRVCPCCQQIWSNANVRFHDTRQAGRLPWLHYSTFLHLCATMGLSCIKILQLETSKLKF